MTRTTDPDASIESGSELRTGLINDLRLVYKPAPNLSSVDPAMVRVVRDPAGREPIRKPAHQRRVFRLGLGVAAAAVLALSLTVGTYIRGVAPTTASAQAVLHHATMAGLQANQITQFVYQVTSSSSFSGTTQFWVRADADGAPVGVALDRASAPDIPRHLAVAYEIYDGQGPPLGGSRLTGQQTVDGVLCDVVQEPNGTTLYFDAKTYILRGANWTDAKGGTPWQARLVQYSSPPASPASGSWHIHG